ncbi:hypothetical protein ASPACDRAFT_1852553 [Aspergillus aculeatus ATCC 16872]|uniref:Uncharacterized protein n=1 Tax=Aspergillus aculeatus (strain ATCC 16872 / CBS 172.66 / WB 5094) TaxID=690307 RepID=A0A1L9X597_ASPA1|nr:uncharacterized protein ASPACDRAFT_1852553 [Aspergillus aculeatus ATCC 16872]OJK03612.1 hypothetical protein ASPACDRAFT_1852553 [Aspergillus aculeatus ATCC 16872]
MQSSIVEVRCAAPDGVQLLLQAAISTELAVNILTPHGLSRLPAAFPIQQRSDEIAVQSPTGRPFVVRDSIRLHFWLDRTAASNERDFYIPVDEAAGIIDREYPTKVHIIIGSDCDLNLQAWDTRNPSMWPIALAPQTQAAKITQEKIQEAIKKNAEEEERKKRASQKKSTGPKPAAAQPAASA